MENNTIITEEGGMRVLPTLPLRGISVFPGMLLNFDVERPMSIASLNQAMGEDQVIFLAAQKEMATDVPTPDDVYAVGTVCRIKQMMKQPGNKTIRVMVEGLVRGQVAAVTSTSPGFMAVIDPLPDAEERSTARVEALILEYALYEFGLTRLEKTREQEYRYHVHITSPRKARRAYPLQALSLSRTACP